MGLAAVGLLPPIVGALTKEAIDVAVTLMCCARYFRHKHGRQKMPTAAAATLHQDDQRMEPTLDRLRKIADEFDRGRSGSGDTDLGS